MSGEPILYGKQVILTMSVVAFGRRRQGGSVILARNMTAEHHLRRRDHGSLQVIYGQRW
jgi:hypothetical protein